jgi:hypothetical protein
MDGRRARNVLGVNADAGPDEIRRAFRALALASHPDHGGDRRTFSEVLAAFETLRRATTPPRPTAAFAALVAPGPRVDCYDSPRRVRLRRDFADVLAAATARLR